MCEVYLHAGWAQEAPPIPIQAKHKGIGQAVEWCRQDVQKCEVEGRCLRVEGVMEPGGGGKKRRQRSFKFSRKKVVNTETTRSRALDVTME